MRPRRDVLRTVGAAAVAALAGCPATPDTGRRAGSLRVVNRHDRAHTVTVRLNKGPRTTITVPAGETVDRPSFAAVEDTDYAVEDLDGTAAVELDGERTTTVSLAFHRHTDGVGHGGPVGGDYVTVVVTEAGELVVRTAPPGVEHVEH